MKKVISILAVSILVTSYTLAQKQYATAGVVEFGADFGYTSEKGSIKYERIAVEYTETTILLAPKVGYFITNNIQIGVALMYTSTKFEFEEESSKTTSTTLFLAPGFIFRTQAKNIYPYARLLIGTESSENETETSLTAYGTDAGVKIKVVEGGLFNIGISYIIGTGKLKNSAKFDLKLSTLMLGIGFTLYK